MNLLIHDLTAKEWNRIADSYSTWNVISDTGTIRPCIGCFRCWTGGSGKCVFRDGYDNMCSLIHEAEEMVVMSRYTYGGFHKRRFPEEKPVTFRFRGCHLTADEKEKTAAYAAAVCRNLRGRVKDVLFDECNPAEEAQALSETSPCEPAARLPSEPVKWPGCLYILIANINWQRLKKR